LDPDLYNGGVLSVTTPPIQSYVQQIGLCQRSNPLAS
jgi:hypothetical protein